jgi:hypothetical protein
LARYCPAIDLTVVAAMNRTPDSARTLGNLVTEAVRIAGGRSNPP